MAKVIINLNEEVKVKLTEEGINILKRQHDELNDKIKSNGGKGIPFELKIDADGYWKTQLWSLIDYFGANVHIGCNPPFDMDIVFEK